MKNKIKKLFGEKVFDPKAIYNESEDKAAIPPMNNSITLFLVS